MATCTEHLLAIIEQIQAVSTVRALPSEVRVHPDQHDYLTGKSNGHFIRTVLSVPCTVDTAVTDGQPTYKVSGGADATTVYASSSADSRY